MNEKRILCVGLGDLGAQVFDLFVRVPGKHHFLVGGRNLDFLHRRTNLSLLAAVQLGYDPDVSCTFMDLFNINQTAQIIAQFQPDIIFCAATLQRWGAISMLPQPLADTLYSAQMGPWLPVHLTLIYKLMQAVKQTGLPVHVINATYPDVVNQVLGKIALAPTTGIGDLANNIPALRKTISLKLGKPFEDVSVYLFMQRYLSSRISRAGSSGGAPFHLTVMVNGEDVTHLLDMSAIFELLPTTFKRMGGTPGQLMTAASAMTVFAAMASDTEIITHAPGPNGLPGGYPVKVSRDAVEVILPNGLSLEQTIKINEACQHYDGIEHIDETGTVFFRKQEMGILKEMFGYECFRMPISEVEDRAKELQAKFSAFVEKHHS